MAYFLYMHYRDITFYVFKRKTKYMLAFLQYTNYYKFTKIGARVLEHLVF